MKYMKILGIAAVAAMAMMAFAVSASATTLEVGGTAKNEAVAIEASLASGTSAVLQTTSGGFANTCTTSTVSGTTTTFTGAAVSGPIAKGGLTFTNCATEKVVVDKEGSLSISWIEGTTNGTVTSSGAEVTVPSPIGALNCKTGGGVDVGTATGAPREEGEETIEHATIHINAVLNCGFLVPSAKWEGTYTVTNPTNLGVVK